MITRPLLAAACCLVLAAPLRAENTAIWEFEVADWKGGAYQSPEGRFSHCSVAATYKSGITMAISLTSEYVLGLVLGKPAWQLPAGSTYELALDIDRRPLGRFIAEALDTRFLSIVIGKDGDTYERLRKGYQLRVQAAREDLYFDLAGTARALDSLLDCVSRANAMTSSSNPFADNRSGGTRNPFASGSSSQGDNEEEMVEGLLLASGLQDIVFVDPATTGFSDALHTWTADGYSGALYVLDRGATDLDHLVNTLLGILAKECSGGFASKPLPLQFIRRYQMKQFTAACRAPRFGQHYYAATAVSNGEKVMVVYNSSQITPDGLQDLNVSMAEAFRILLPK